MLEKAAGMLYWRNSEVKYLRAIIIRRPASFDELRVPTGLLDDIMTRREAAGVMFRLAPITRPPPVELICEPHALRTNMHHRISEIA